MTTLRAYYLGTPLFVLFDLVWGLVLDPARNSTSPPRIAEAFR